MENTRVCRYIIISTSYTKIIGGSMVPVISRKGSNSIIQTATDRIQQIQIQDLTETNDFFLETLLSEVKLVIPDKNIGALLRQEG